MAVNRIGRTCRCAASAAALALAVGLPSASAWAATYKWVDEKGVVHYTDKMPPEAVNKGTTVLDKQARPVKKIDPAPTPEQVKAREAEIERAKEGAREQEIAARRDRALLQSYTNEGEIDLARQRMLATIDAQRTAAQAYSAQLGKRRDEILKTKAASGAKGLPVAMERELEGIDTELARQSALIALKQRERDTANARYDADKARWRELRAIADANAAAASGTAPRTVSSSAAPAGPAAAVK